MICLCYSRALQAASQHLLPQRLRASVVVDVNLKAGFNSSHE
jgi:hypothetical protein